MKILKRLTALAVILAIAASMMSVSHASDTEEATGKEPLATLVFASDFQPESENSSAQGTLASAVRAASKGKTVDALIMCGDYTNISGQSNYNGDPEKAASYAKQITDMVPRVVGKNSEAHFLQGNHDAFDEGYMDATGAYEYENYILYIMNTQDANPWMQGSTGSEEIVKNASAALEAYLNSLIEDGDSRPVIIATHVPLHFSGRTSSMYRGGVGDNLYSSYFFNVINKAAEELNIVFVFGHNHSNGWDSYIGAGCVYKRPGDVLLIPDIEGIEGTSTDRYTEETLNFTYMNAGYVGHYSNYPTGADKSFTASALTIYEDCIVVERFTSAGHHVLSAAGVFNQYYDDSSLIKEEHLSVAIQSPDTIQRITPKVRVTLGDINNDGRINAKDSNMLKRIVIGSADFGESAFAAADINGDGSINTKDIYLLKKLIIG